MTINEIVTIYYLCYFIILGTEWVQFRDSSFSFMKGSERE